MKIKRLLFLFSLPLLLAACTSYKNVPYLQNPEVVNDFGEILPLYDAKIMPKDLLSITVNTTDPQAAAPFNLTVQTPLNAALTNINTTTQPTLQQYLVNNSGEIDFPVIGTLRVGGLTKNEAESLIRERLRPYLKEAPIVTVRMANYKISVLGEVARIDGMLDMVLAEMRSTKAAGEGSVPIVITGDDAEALASLVGHSLTVDDALTLRGLAELYRINQKPRRV